MRVLFFVAVVIAALIALLLQLGGGEEASFARCGEGRPGYAVVTRGKTPVYEDADSGRVSADLDLAQVVGVCGQAPGRERTLVHELPGTSWAWLPGWLRKALFPLARGWVATEALLDRPLCLDAGGKGDRFLKRVFAPASGPKAAWDAPPAPVRLLDSPSPRGRTLDTIDSVGLFYVYDEQPGEDGKRYYLVGRYRAWSYIGNARPLLGWIAGDRCAVWDTNVVFIPNKPGTLRIHATRSGAMARSGSSGGERAYEYDRAHPLIEVSFPMLATSSKGWGEVLFSSRSGGRGPLGPLLPSDTRAMVQKGYVRFKDAQGKYLYTGHIVLLSSDLERTAALLGQVLMFLNKQYAQDAEQSIVRFTELTFSRPIGPGESLRSYIGRMAGIPSWAMWRDCYSLTPRRVGMLEYQAAPVDLIKEVGLVCARLADVQRGVTRKLIWDERRREWVADDSVAEAAPGRMFQGKDDIGLDVIALGYL